MAYPNSDWPTSVDTSQPQVDGVNTVWADTFNYQDEQIILIQTFIGVTGDLIGVGIAGSGIGGALSPTADGGTAFQLAARNDFTSGKLFSLGDDYDNVYSEKFYVDYAGAVYTAGSKVLSEGAGEVAALTAKGTPTTADYLLIEDAADSNNKKSITIADLPSGTDADAIHDNVAGEIAAVTAKGTPTTSDYLLIEDAADSNNKKSITLGDLPGGGGSADGRGFAIVIGNSVAGDTSAICDYLDVGDCVQLKAGIEAAAGKPVYIRPGTYDWNNGVATSNQITVPVGTRVLGAGMDAVTIRLLDGATEGEAFVIQGGGSVLEEFEISVPTPTALVNSLSSQGYIYNEGSTGSSGLERIRVIFEDSGWSTLADQNYVAMRYVIYSASGGDRFFVDRCEFIDVPNYDSTPALEPARLQVAYCAGQLDTVEFRENFSWGGYAAYELFGDQVVFADNIVGSVAYDYILRLGGNGFSSGTERPARIVNNDLILLYDPAEGAQNGILCLTNVGLIVAANNITLEGGTHANTRAIDIGNGDKATIIANRVDAESGWQYGVDCGSSSTGTIVANHFGSATVTGVTTGWAIGFNYPLTTVDGDAIHDNVDGEINAITEKATPIGADLIVIEDSAASFAKKKVQITNLPGGSGTDADAIHDNVAAEISAITAKATPTTSDYLVIEDAADSNNKKSITLGDLPAAAPAAHDLAGSLHNADTLANLNAKISDATLDDSSSTRDPNAHTLGGTAHSTDTLANLNAKISDATLDDSSSPRTDSDAIHDNVTGEINAIAEKVTPVGADLLIIEDSAAGNAKKKVQITNLPGGADADAIHDNVAAEISAITAKATPTTSDFLVIEDAADSNNKKSITVGDLPAATPAAHNLGGAEHSADTLANLNAKVSDATLDDITGQRDADSLQGGDIDASLAPTDGQVLTYDGTGTQWTAASPAEGSSYLDIGRQTVTDAGGSPDTAEVGRVVFDASQHNTITLKAVVNSVFNTTGSVDVKLYDDGSPSTPGTPRLVSTLNHTDDTLTYEVLEQALTVVASSPTTNEILGEARVYRAVIEITATSSDTATVNTVGFVAVGTGDVVTLSADAIQAIVMSLNA